MLGWIALNTVAGTVNEKTRQTYIPRILAPPLPGLSSSRMLLILSINASNRGANSGQQAASDSRKSTNSYVRKITPTSNPNPIPPPPTPRLGYNDISSDGASALASLLHAGSSALDTLELQGNRVGDAGAAALANGLTGGGKRGRRGAEQGRPAAAAAAGLRSLNLAGNGIGCAGGVALAKALTSGRSGGGRGVCVLEELELAGNAVSQLSGSDLCMYICEINCIRFFLSFFFFVGA